MLTLEERFWSQVTVCAHGQTCRRCCWEWQGTTTVQGYGVLSVDGQTQRASHVALILYAGTEVLPLRTTIRRGLFALHRCDRPACTNYHHLFWGTPSDNVHDELDKRRVFLQRRLRMTREDLDRLAQPYEIHSL